MKALFIASILIITGAGIFYFFRNNPQAKTKTIIVQPFYGIDRNTVDYVYNKLKPVFNKVELRKAIALPPTAFYKPRNRYRADSIIAILKRQTSNGSTTIGMTASDISTTTRNHQDWGIMGLAYCPGSACVVSTFRLSKKIQKEQFYKVSIHELGHAAGLPHCKIKSCFMRDANGQNPLNEETGFCNDCKTHLKKQGWKLN